MDKSATAIKEYEETSYFGLAAAIPFAPCCWNYHINASKEQFSFKYGPVCDFGISVKTEDIDPLSVTTGYYSCVDNLSTFGGFGIRYNFFTKEYGYNMFVYGNYIKFATKTGAKYHIGCKDPDAILKALELSPTNKKTDTVTEKATDAPKQ